MAEVKELLDRLNKTSSAGLPVELISPIDVSSAISVTQAVSDSGGTKYEHSVYRDELEALVKSERCAKIRLLVTLLGIRETKDNSEILYTILSHLSGFKAVLPIPSGRRNIWSPDRLYQLWRQVTINTEMSKRSAQAVCREFSKQEPWIGYLGEGRTKSRNSGKPQPVPTNQSDKTLYQRYLDAQKLSYVKYIKTKGPYDGYIQDGAEYQTWASRPASIRLIEPGEY